LIRFTLSDHIAAGSAAARAYPGEVDTGSPIRIRANA